jgi:hypothetical protein
MSELTIINAWAPAKGGVSPLGLKNINVEERKKMSTINVKTTIIFKRMLFFYPEDKRV